jgi:hypothetical protein
MNREEIIETIKATYSREIRKGLVRTILEQEKKEDALVIKKQYKIINQIFSYVLQQSGWRMGENSGSWDASPLGIMIDIFPKLSTTKWYEEQNLTTTQNVEVEVREK